MTRILRCSRVRGYLPFDANDVNTILQNTLRAQIPMDDDHWRNVSPEGKLYTRYFVLRFAFS